MAIYKPRRPRQYHVHEAIREWNQQLSALRCTDARVLQALLHEDVTPEQIADMRVGLRKLYKSANEVYDRLVEKYKNEYAGGRRLTDQLRRPNRPVKFTLRVGDNNE
jgi:CHAD domain-containing protein